MPFLSYLWVGSRKTLEVDGITEESRGKTGKAHLTAAVYVEGDSKLNFSGSVLTFENALIVNKGETNFKELSHTELQASSRFQYQNDKAEALSPRQI